MEAEILRNGERYKREKEERKASRIAYLQERKARKEREAGKILDGHLLPHILQL